jgi:hypothetical protein
LSIPPDKARALVFRRFSAVDHFSLVSFLRRLFFPTADSSGARGAVSVICHQCLVDLVAAAQSVILRELLQGDIGIIFKSLTQGFLDSNYFFAAIS